MKPTIILQPPEHIYFENVDIDNPTWTENMLGPPIVKYGKEPSISTAKISTKINIDADILAWFKTQGTSYEILINKALRHVMNAGLSIN